MLSTSVISAINSHVLIWLATADKEGQPNTSPKQIFHANEDGIFVAHIASPKSLKNLSENTKVCVSTIDPFTQRGYKIYGKASLLDRNNAASAEIVDILTQKAGEHFPILEIISITATNCQKILAPSYVFLPERTEDVMIQSALQDYDVHEKVLSPFVDNFVQSTTKQFQYYKVLAERAIDQITEKQFFQAPDIDANSIAIIVHHITGNLRSRWINFFTEDGEKPWRTRDKEFISPDLTMNDIMQEWEAAWEILFSVLEQVNYKNFNIPIYIRNQAHSIMDACLRQQCHYSYHVGQIVWIARMLVGQSFQSLSIPRGQSKAFNERTANQRKNDQHFTDQLIQKDD